MLNLQKNKSSKPNVFVGLDYNKNCLHLIQVELANLNYKITNYSCLYADKLDEKSPHKLRKQIQKLKLKTNKVKIAIPDTTTIRKNLVVSEKLTNKDLQELVLIEVAKISQENISDYCFDYQVFTKDNQQELRLIIAKKQSIMPKINTLSSLGFEVIEVNLQSSCIYKLLKYLLRINITDSVCVWLEINTETIDTYIFHEGLPIFINSESHNNTQNYQQNILLKIKRDLKYLEMKNSNLKIDRIYLTCEYSQLITLQQRISDICNTEVVKPDIFHKIAIPNLNLQTEIQENSHKINMILGLAL